MKRNFLSIIILTLFLFIALFVTSCNKDEDNGVEPVAPTGLTIFIQGTTNPFIIYGGEISKSDSNAIEHIRADPEHNGFRILDTVTTTYTFQGAYAYYLIQPVHDGATEIDAMELLGPNKYYSGLFEDLPSGEHLTVYGSNCFDDDKLCGPPDQQSARIMSGFINGTTYLQPFMLFPGYNWY